MRIKRVEKFTSSVTKGLLSTQQAIISQIVCSMLVCRSLCLADLARCFQPSTDFRHNLIGQLFGLTWCLKLSYRRMVGPCLCLAGQLEEVHSRAAKTPSKWSS